MADNAFSYGWDVDRARFVDLNTGRFVPKDLVLSTMQDRIDESLSRLSDMAGGLLSGDVGLGDWQDAFIVELRRLYTENAALGGGGWAQMTPQMWGEVGANLRQEYGYLQGFVDAIAEGKLSEAQIQMRTQMYADGVRSAFYDAERRTMEASGYTEERRNLNPGESCDDCQTAAGHWEPIGTLPQIGDSQCGSRCNCDFDYR